jgi:hypothetical protein
MSPTNPEGEARRKIEASIAHRKEAFALSHLTATGAGYTLKFRLGIVDIVRTTADEGVLTDEGRLNKLLDGVRKDFVVLFGAS